jgi:hypothetical protein
MSDTEIQEREYLMQCKPYLDPDGTYSGRLATWSATTRPCTDWQGITCAAWRITGIDLSAQGLGGSLCRELRDLPELVTVKFNNNSFTGEDQDASGSAPGVHTVSRRQLLVLPMRCFALRFGPPCLLITHAATLLLLVAGADGTSS